MSTAYDVDNERSTLSTNNLIPVSSDKIVLVWDGNFATIDGMVFECGRHYKRTGLFQPLIKNRAVALSNGKIAVDSPTAYIFITDQNKDPRDITSPCPPTPKRVEEVNLKLVATDPTKLITKASSVPDDHKHTIVVAPHSVDIEDAKFLSSLWNVFGQTDSSDDLLEKADGSGLKLLIELQELSKKADHKDLAVVSATFTNIVRDGVNGELTLSSFNAYIKKYKAAIRNMKPDARPKSPAEVEMIAVIAMKDSASRELYELKSTMSPPTTLDEASTILNAILRGRVRCEEIDQLSTGSGGKNLSLLSAPAATTAAPDLRLRAALAAAGVNPVTLKPEVITALVAALAPADPRKTDAGQDKKVEVPRGSDGKPLKWVPGMATCRCGIDGGKHLFKDCPKAKEKKEKKEKEKRALAAASAAGASGLNEEQLRKALAALFSSAVPAVDLTAGAEDK